MKLNKILASAFAVAALLSTGCVKDEFQPGVDSSKPGVTDVQCADVPYNGKSVTIQWDAAQAVNAGAKSFTMELVLDSVDSLEALKPDNYDKAVSATVPVEDGKTVYTGTVSGQTKGNIYYIRVRANYKFSVMSDWCWLQNANGDRAKFKVGRGIISDGIEDPFLYKVTPTSTGIIVKWDAIPGANGYVVEHRKVGDASWTVSPIDDPKTVSFKIQNLPSETEYEVRAKTKTPSGDSEYCETVKVKTRQPGSYPAEMKTADEFLAWLEGGIVEVEAAQTFSLGADIDLAGAAFTAMDEPLMGTFDGKGYTIKGVSSTLFFQNEGTIKNVKVELTDQAVQTNEFGAFVQTNKANITNCEVKGALSYVLASDTEVLKIGGIACDNSGVIDNVTFDGNIDITSDVDQTKAIIVGGIAAYNDGEIKACTNNAAIKYANTAKVKGFAIAGIVGYTEGPVAESINNGSVVASGTCPAGKSTILTTSDGTPALAGICAYGFTDNFAIRGCTNKGEVNYSLSAVEKYTSNFNRNQFAGIVANPYGPVEDCTNDGPINVSLSSSDGSQYTGAEHIICVGGIGGGDYYGGPAGGRTSGQNKTNYTNCTNNGPITIFTVVQKSNSTCGGICGWPGAEEARDSKTSGCINNGEITIKGSGKTRTGGIHGGTGNIENCVNNGKIHIISADPTTPIGGIAGFHSQSHFIKGTKSFGTVVSDIETTQGVGGLVGNQGNAASKISNCEILCKVSNNGPDALLYTGMVVGYWNGSSSATQYGTSSAPVKVGGVEVINGKATTLTAGNYMSTVQGTKNSGGSHTLEIVFNSAEYVDPDGPSEDQPAVSLSAPTNVSVSVLYNSVTITWDAVDGAEWYVADYKPKASDEWKSAPQVTECSCTIEGLAHGTDYDFRVKAFSSNASGYSDIVTEPTLPEVNLAKPVVTLSADAVSITAEWAAITGATGYGIEYKTSEAAEWTSGGQTAELKKVIEGLQPDTEYQVRVQALGEGGNTGEFCDPVAISTEKSAITYPYTIKNAADLIAWIPLAPTCAATDEVILGGDLDLAGQTIDQISSFAGIFNGNGKTIKNLSATAPVFVSVSGTVKDFTLDSSCSITMPASGTAGFIGTNTGAVEKVISNAVIVTPKEVTAAYKLGVVVGENKGTVKGCVNNSALKFDLTANAGSHCIGGVVGYIDVAKGVVAVENCVNTAEVQFKVSGTPKNNYIGGVVGSTPHHKRASAAHNGTVKGCSNSGKVSQVWTLSASGSYCNVGGVAGYLEGDIENCTNSGEVNITSPEDVAASSTRPSVGGVCGYIGYTAKGCTNTGLVSAIGVYAAGTEGNDGALGCHQPLLGGVFGGAGVNYQAASEEGEINDCHNKANLNFVVEQKTGGGTQSRLGGVVGYSSVPVRNCTNTGTLTFKPGHKVAYMGGIVGHASMDVESCTNTGKVEYDGRCATLVPADAAASTQAYLGGIVGYTYTDLNVKNCESSAELSFTGVQTKSALSYIGGILGSYNKGIVMEGCVSSGAISVDAACAMCIGGVAGAFNGTMNSCEFAAKSTISVSKIAGDSGKEPEIGGISGYANAAFNSCKALGSISISDVAVAYIGGISGGFGAADKVWKDNNVNPQISTSIATKGSVLGRFRSAGTNAVHFVNGTLGSNVSGLELCAELNGNTVDTVEPAPSSK